MIVAIAGRARALADRLRAAGHTVILLPRVPGRLPGVDVIVDFRPSGTRTLVDRVRDLTRRPALFLSVSADALAAEALGVRVILLRPAEDVFPLLRREAV